MTQHILLDKKILLLGRYAFQNSHHFFFFIENLCKASGVNCSLKVPIHPLPASTTNNHDVPSDSSIEDVSEVSAVKCQTTAKTLNSFIIYEYH